MTDLEELKELAITDDGDLIIGPDGDLATSKAGRACTEHILVRLKTYPNDALAMPNVGCPIESYIGRPNTRETGLALESEVKDALTFDGFLSRSTLEVTAVPFSPSQILIVIEPDVSAPASAGTHAFSIDLLEGTVQAVD